MRWLALGTVIVAATMGWSCSDLTFVGGTGGMTSSSDGGTTLLVGSNDVVPTAPDGGEDDIEYGREALVGSAHAAQFVAKSTGVVGHLWMYLFESSAASRVEMGLYDDDAGQPGVLLGSGVVMDPADGWNELAFVPSQTSASVTVTTGQKYWIAVLDPFTPENMGTSVDFGFHATNGASFYQDSASTTLTTLPATWPSGPQGSGTLAQFYASE